MAVMTEIQHGSVSVMHLICLEFLAHFVINQGGRVTLWLRPSMSDIDVLLPFVLETSIPSFWTWMYMTNLIPCSGSWFLSVVEHVTPGFFPIFRVRSYLKLALSVLLQ